MRRLFALLILFTCLVWAPLAASETAPVTARLITDSKGFVPGQTFTVALKLTQDLGWHTYWRDPGDAGLANTLDFNLPAGVHAGEPQWPKPVVLKDPGGLTGYGYLNVAYLLVPISVDSAFKARRLTLNGKVTWLACKDICLPGNADVSLSLRRRSTNAPSSQAPIFDQLRPSLGLPPDAYKPGGPSQAVPVTAPAAASGAGGLFFMLALALLGGLLLNLMPCVLPVLSLKALSFVEHSHQKRSVGLKLAMAFAAGVLFSFWTLAAVALVLKKGGAAVGWGFQFQQPGFVLFMAGILVAFSLNLFGLFEVWLPGGAMTGLSKAGHGRGLVASFGQGLVMTLLATPCTAPFLGPALGYAFAAPAINLMAVFTAVAIGLALPYVLLAAIPGARAWLPKPGAWMLRFKEAMGFLLLATVVWLLWLLGEQVGVDGLGWAAVWLLYVAAAAWIWGRFAGLEQTQARRRTITLLAVVLVFGSGLWLWPKVLSGQAGQAQADEGWKSWSDSAVASLRAEGKPVFVDFGAQWCWTCKVNERGTLASDEVRNAFKKNGVALLKADWTRQDPAISAAIKSFGRGGVPLYVYYPVNGEAVVLPEVITPGLVLKALGAQL